jgi:repressor LexA
VPACPTSPRASSRSWSSSSRHRSRAACRPPAEIAEALGFRSANAAEEHLRALQRKGVIDLKAGASRGIVLKDVLREQMGLPLVGRVAAGRPILAEEHVEGRYQVDPQLFNPRPHYLLRSPA